MSKTLIVHGHGKWYPNDGYVQLPKGMKVSFYTEGLKNLYYGFALAYLTGSDQALPGGEADMEVGEYRSAPNYTLSQLSLSQHTKAMAIYNGGSFKDNADVRLLAMKPGANPAKLATLIKLAEKNGISNLVWLACRAVNFQHKVGGRALGVNAPQTNRLVTKDELEFHKLWAETM
jgi:hypothetical protein